MAQCSNANPTVEDWNSVDPTSCKLDEDATDYCGQLKAGNPISFYKDIYFTVKLSSNILIGRHQILTVEFYYYLLLQFHNWAFFINLKGNTRIRPILHF